jgi:hypothetical protein
VLPRFVDFGVEATSEILDVETNERWILHRSESFVVTGSMIDRDCLRRMSPQLKICNLAGDAAAGRDAFRQRSLVA